MFLNFSYAKDVTSDLEKIRKEMKTGKTFILLTTFIASETFQM